MPGSTRHTHASPQAGATTPAGAQGPEGGPAPAPHPPLPSPPLPRTNTLSRFSRVPHMHTPSRHILSRHTPPHPTPPRPATHHPATPHPAPPRPTGHVPALLEGGLAQAGIQRLVLAGAGLGGQAGEQRRIGGGGRAKQLGGTHHRGVTGQRAWHTRTQGWHASLGMGSVVAGAGGWWRCIPRRPLAVSVRALVCVRMCARPRMCLCVCVCLCAACEGHLSCPRTEPTCPPGLQSH